MPLYPTSDLKTCAQDLHPIPVTLLCSICYIDIGCVTHHVLSLLNITLLASRVEVQVRLSFCYHCLLVSAPSAFIFCASSQLSCRLPTGSSRASHSFDTRCRCQTFFLSSLETQTQVRKQFLLYCDNELYFFSLVKA